MHRRSIHADHMSDDSNGPQANGGSLKRKRPQLTCVNCKRRKTKCDKTYPCSSCVSRGEKHECVYEPGATPPPVDPSNGADHQALKEQLDRIENRLQQVLHPASEPVQMKHPMITYRSLASQGLYGSESQEFQALDSLHMLAIPPPRSKPADPTPIHSSPFPNISDPDQVHGKTARWMRDVAELLDAIPRPAQLAAIMDYYFSEVQGMRWYIGERAMRAEVEQFENTRYGPDRMTVDPAWLAIVCAMTWVVCHYINDEHVIPSHLVDAGFGRSSIRPLAELMFECFDSALSSSAWVIKPQVRVLQALNVVMDLGQQFMYNVDKLMGPTTDKRRILWFDMAVGITKALKLDNSTSYEELMQLNDPALPPSKPLYCVQLARRLFSHMLFFDTINMVPTVSISPYFPEGSYSTPSAENYLEEALMTATSADERPSHPWEFTSYLWEYHSTHLFLIWRRIRTYYFSGAETPTYDIVLRLSDDLNTRYQHLLTLKAVGGLDELGQLAFMFLDCSYQQRFLHTHRAYFLRSYMDSTFSASQRASLEAAAIITRSHRIMMEKYHQKPSVKFSQHIFVHHISSLVVFFTHGLLQPAKRSEMLQNLMTSRDIFAQYKNNHPAYLRGASRGSHVASELIRVLENPPENGDDLVTTIAEIRTRALEADRAANQAPPSTATPTASIPAFNSDGFVKKGNYEVESQIWDFESVMQSGLADFSWVASGAGLGGTNMF